MRVHLLTILRLRLEIMQETLPIDEPVPGNNTRVRASREHVQERRLACAAFAHESRQLAGAHVPADVVQERARGCARAFADGDGVAEVLPGEDVWVCFEACECLFLFSCSFSEYWACASGSSCAALAGVVEALGV
jgi:hypothetical protein